jgi:hypothetical protein
MGQKILRFFCQYCNKTLALNFSDEFLKEFRHKADKWPYPLIYPHDNHFAIIYVDENIVERGVIVSRIDYKE